MFLADPAIGVPIDAPTAIEVPPSKFNSRENTAIGIGKPMTALPALLLLMECIERFADACAVLMKQRIIEKSGLAKSCQCLYSASILPSDKVISRPNLTGIAPCPSIALGNRRTAICLLNQQTLFGLMQTAF
jgi:hypothetical protein